ncbi:hypothetical protein FA15DRAFT_709282 [Coprinopsis marcescibilis]|uniref:Uncharacterized protein n=1 Tax=Coprinopsis marcescibilis TaxID=230819 RepID=A0A5C3KG23_COPMA|nr:hypothetical protein FA15DRAFT_709282 [Coprinopsis marcescibilis]
MGPSLSTLVGPNVFGLQHYIRGALGAHVLQGAQEVQIINSNFTVAGGNITYHNTAGGAASTITDNELLDKIMDWLSTVKGNTLNQSRSRYRSHEALSIAHGNHSYIPRTALLFFALPLIVLPCLKYCLFNCKWQKDGTQPFDASWPERAQEVQIINSNFTVAGGNITYHNTAGGAASTITDNELLDKIMDWLSKLNFRNIFNENMAKRTPETGREVINSDWFQEWLMSLLGGIVWGTGMPGARKRVLAESDVRNALDGLPQGLDGMYDATMARIKGLPGPQADLAIRVLIWIAYAQRPLTVEELVLAVSVCPGAFQFNDQLEPARIESILLLCCGLVQAEYSGILGEKSQATLPGRSTPCALIASTSISLLRHYGFHNVSSQGSDDDGEIWNQYASLEEERGPMANYPYQYWGFHATNSRSIPAPVLEFLDDCEPYPSFYNEQSSETNNFDLPDFYHDEDYCTTLQSAL